MRWLYRRFFRHIEVDESWSDEVRQAAQKGVVVYVARSISFLDFLCLDFLVKRFALPLVRFVNDLGLWILEPFGRGERRLRFRRQIPEEEGLASVVRDGFSALLFLRKPPKLGSTARRGRETEADLIRTLVETQRKLDVPILLVPQTFVWNMRPPQQKRGLVDLFFGPVEWPGKIRVFFQFLFNYRNARLRSGTAFDLRAFIEDHQDLTDGEIADKVRYALLRRIERERKLVQGPVKKTTGRIQEELLRSPRVRRQILANAKQTDRPVAKVEKEARTALEKLAANQQPWAVLFFLKVLTWVFRRIYDGLVVDQEGVERVREAARRGTLIYLPSHKSHVDYLVLSYLLQRQALQPPLIAAGDNLNFFPIGFLLRRGGAFFIKRSFKGKRLYPALVDAYIRKLLVEGFPIEFFLEGGRSRTGKLLSPKFGLLSMVVDAAMKARLTNVSFVPVSIGYERIVEERSYVHELGGGEKQKESLGGLLETPKLLRSKYGRLYVQFGEILELSEMLGDRDVDGLSPAERRRMVQEIAHETLRRIEQVTVVTPAAMVATALLVHRRRGIRMGELRSRIEMLFASLRAKDARVADPLTDAEGALRQDTLDETLALFVDAGLVEEHETGGETIYRVPGRRRMALEYYKNNVLHFFVPAALVANAIQVGEEPVAVPTLVERVGELMALFEHELNVTEDPAELVEAALADMERSGEIERRADGVRAGDAAAGKNVEVYGDMLRSYFEAYLLAARAVSTLPPKGGEVDGMQRKEWLKKTLELGQRMYLAGELEHRESISKPKLETAIRALKERGLLTYGPMDTLLRGEDASADDFERLQRQLRAYLG
tara:strand:+ start:673 stop:3171 length:2499 start_codon:yes stop_codon:yes gene_type:complete